jgi:hypothetical protein
LSTPAIAARFFADDPADPKGNCDARCRLARGALDCALLVFWLARLGDMAEQAGARTQREVSKLYDHHFKGRRAQIATGSLRLSHKGRGAPSRGYTQTKSIAL